MRFADSYWGILFILLPLLWYLKKKQIPPSIPHPDMLYRLTKYSTTNNRKPYLQWILRMSALSLIILALMRPQKGIISDITNKYGIDIMVCFDVSSSMLAEDLLPNRISVAKDLLARFIKNRPNDRMGLIVFGAQSYLQSPLTNDHQTLLYFLEKIHIGMAEDGTAIGMAIANGVKRLKDSQAKSKIILLITDGDNNSGAIDPVTASRLAATYNIKIYAIGVGNPEGAPIPVGIDSWGRKVYARNPDGSLFLTKMNPEGLRKISAITDGAYFIAQDTKAFYRALKEIDNLEKTKYETRRPHFYEDKFKIFLLVALFMLILEYFIVRYYLKPFPMGNL